MRSRVGLWGGSCAVRLPKMAVETLGLREGEDIDIEIEDNAVVIRRGRPAYRLEDLVEEAKRQQRPPAFDDGPTGRESL